MLKLVSVEQMRALEAAAFAAGTDEAQLQQQAAHAVAEAVLTLPGPDTRPLARPGARCAVLVGHGNNGRDGALAAAWLAQRGLLVDLILAPRHAVTEAELAQLAHVGAHVVGSDDAVAIEGALTGATLALDALAGIGIHGALREPLAGLVRHLNAAHSHGLRVVALDVPSGTDADTGAIPGDAVQADWTVTLGAVKQGLLRFPAAEHVGRLIGRRIGIPIEAEQSLPYRVIEPPDLAALVPARALDAHKYRFGRVLVIAGSDHFLGAPVLCSGGALRVGAGLVTVASTRDVRLNVAGHLPEATFSTADVAIAADPDAAIAAIEPYLRSHASVVLGPGLGRGPSVTRFVGELLARRPSDHHLVIDADGLVALAELADWPQRLGPNVVLTPHTGELERLVGQPLPDDVPPWQQAGELARRWGCTLVAKGPFTSVAGPDGQVAVWPHANAALATGGTGDVLAGVCAGLLAQTTDTHAAATLAVALHALAAERLIQTRHWRTLLASDLLPELPATLAEVAR